MRGRHAKAPAESLGRSDGGFVANGRDARPSKPGDGGRPASAPLAGRLADGDPLAPRDLVERHYAELYRYAFAMLRNVHAAEDAVHDAFVNALEALGRYPSERVRGMELRAWMFRITLNVVRNRVRKNRDIPVEEVPEKTERRPDGEHFMDALDALGHLPEKQKTAVALRYILDLPYAEIAGATGQPENTVKTLVRRGLKNMRKHMNVEEEPK